MKGDIKMMHSKSFIIKSGYYVFAGITMKSLIFYFEWLYDKVIDMENKHEVFNWEIRH